MELPKLLHPKEVQRRTTLSRAQLDRMVKSSEFPMPIQLSVRRIAWLEGDVEAWMEEKAKG